MYPDSWLALLWRTKFPGYRNLALLNFTGHYEMLVWTSRGQGQLMVFNKVAVNEICFDLTQWQVCKYVVHDIAFISPKCHVNYTGMSMGNNEMPGIRGTKTYNIIFIWKILGQRVPTHNFLQIHDIPDYNTCIYNHPLLHYSDSGDYLCRIYSCVSPPGISSVPEQRWNESDHLKPESVTYWTDSIEPD